MYIYIIHRKIHAVCYFQASQVTKSDCCSSLHSHKVTSTLKAMCAYRNTISTMMWETCINEKMAVLKLYTFVEVSQQYHFSIWLVHPPVFLGSHQKSTSGYLEAAVMPGTRCVWQDMWYIVTFYTNNII